jgi:amino acid transporter
MKPEQADHKLSKGSIGVAHIVFFVVAAAAPLTAVVGASPAAFSLGNGPGVPGTYLLVGLLYIVFSAGFTAMNRFVSSAGGFYTYVAIGLGKPAGLASALVALATYNAIDVAVYGIFGFFAKVTISQAGGPDLPWIVYAAALAAASYYSGKRDIAFSGAVLGVCMIAEIAILAVLAVAILVTGGGPDGITFLSFQSDTIFSKGMGIALVFVIASFIGFEATAIFGEEAVDPKRTVASATYISVILIAGFYAFVTWAVTLHYGAGNIMQIATSHSADMYLTAVEVRLGKLAAYGMQILLMTSLFAAALSFHNTANRYLYALGREGVFSGRFALTHPVHRSPYVAGQMQTAIALSVAGVLWILGCDPYTVVFAWMGTFASIGILFIQLMVSMAVIVFFWKDRRDVGLYCRLVSPVISVAGLTLSLILMIANLSLVSGSESWVIDAFPALIGIIAIAGLALAIWIKQARPMIYRNLGQSTI